MKNQLELLSKANKTSSLAKNESGYNYDNKKFAFYEFCRDFKALKKGRQGLNTTI